MFYEWIIYFLIYSFLGWCFETTLDSVEQRQFINRGFLRGPVIPIYGFGAIIMIFAAKPVLEKPTLVFIFGAISATILEYFTGFILEVIFKTRYWDYSGCHYQIKGRICAEATLMWGFMTLFVNYNVHTHISNMVHKLNGTILVISAFVFTAVFLADAVISFKTAADVNSILKRLAEINKLTQKLELHNEKDSSESIKSRLKKLSAEHKSSLTKIGLLKKDFIRSHHNAHSTRFNSPFSELKEKIKQHSKKT